MSEKVNANALPLVTSLAETDTLLAVAADGGGKRITKGNLAVQKITTSYPEGERWMRILSIDGTGAFGIVMARNANNATAPRPIMLAFCFADSRYGCSGYTYVNKLCGASTVFTKARLVYPTGNTSTQLPCYLEVYMSKSTEKLTYTDAIALSNATLLNELGGIPEGYTSKEYDLSETVGGVIDLLSARYELTQKGGRHERSDGSDGGDSESVAPQYDVRKKLNLRLQRGDDTRRVLHFRSDDEQPSESSVSRHPHRGARHFHGFDVDSNLPFHLHVNGRGRGNALHTGEVERGMEAVVVPAYADLAGKGVAA